MSRTSTDSSSPPDGPEPLPSVPERPEEFEAALAALDLRPSRSLGQSFLTDAFVADALAALAVPTSREPVYEVGGGLGIVTRALLRRGIETVNVVERDRRLARHLSETFGARVRVERADALSFDFPDDAIVVGSLPYSIATPLVLRLMARRLPRIVALVQKEVAERFGALPGTRSYGRPTILARLYGTVELYREVPASAFYPRPKVAGRIFTHRPRLGELPVGSVDRLERLVRVLFSSRRKQLGNLLPRLASGGRTPDVLARAAGWPDGWERLRPEDLPPERYFALEHALAEAAGTPHDPSEEEPARSPTREA